ncbi:hypothetical protein BHM03_00026155 [Ensete ventricosum]|nr:hypothetical protein BHM03_00026155 [Ensete ventricosum]
MIAYLKGCTANRSSSLLMDFCILDKPIQDIMDDKDDRTGSGRQETISIELASAINDGLFFYEQVMSCCSLAFHHFREERGETEPIRKHPELERLLREKYHSLEDFRSDENAAKASEEE